MEISKAFSKCLGLLRCSSKLFSDLNVIKTLVCNFVRTKLESENKIKIIKNKIIYNVNKIINSKNLHYKKEEIPQHSKVTSATSCYILLRPLPCTSLFISTIRILLKMATTAALMPHLYGNSR